MANHLAMAALIEHGDEILLETPTYEPILALANYLGAKVNRFTRRFENDYAIDVHEIAAKVTAKTRLIILTNLHNPSSVLTAEETVREIGSVARKVGARVLIDEVYLEAMFDQAPPSAVRFGPEFVATRSLTKGYGLSGLRCGWILAAPEVAEKIRLLDDIFDAVGPHPAERLSVVALSQLEKLKARATRVLEENRRALKDFVHSRSDLEVVWSSAGTTMFPKLKRGDVEQLGQRLLERYDTSIVPGRFFEAPQHFRIGLCCLPEAFRQGLDSLGRALDELAV
jgi:aspartate/methionine/tyrosine aminotransferase